MAVTLTIPARQVKVGDQVTDGLTGTTTVTKVRLLSQSGAILAEITTTTLGEQLIPGSRLLTVIRPGGGSGDQPDPNTPVTAGTFASYELPAGKITSGTLAIERIPDVVTRDPEVGALAAASPAVRAASVTAVLGSDELPLFVAGQIAQSGTSPGTGFAFTTGADGLTYIVGNVAPPPAVPGQVTALTASSGRGQSVLTWTDPASDPVGPVTDHLVQYKLRTASEWTTFAHAASAATTITVTGLANSLLYDFRVAAVNLSGPGTYSATASATIGQVNGTVFNDQFTRTATELVGTSPTTGPSAWAGTTGMFSVDGARMQSKGSTGLVTVNTGARGDMRLTGTMRFATDETVVKNSRLYWKYLDGNNYLYFSVGCSASGVPSFSLFCNAAGAGGTLALGFPAGAVPSNTAAADYPFTLDQAGLALSVTFNGVTRTTTLTQTQADALAAATAIAFTSNSVKHQFDDLTVAVNGTYV